jgi:hypothetical protein
MLLDGRVGKPGTSTPYRIDFDEGLANKLTIGGRTLSPAFLDTTAHAKKHLYLNGTPASGDVVKCSFTLADGKTATETVVATGAESTTELAKRVIHAINYNKILAEENGVVVRRQIRGKDPSLQFLVEARNAGPQGILIAVDYSIVPAKQGEGLDYRAAFKGRLQDNADMLTSRGMLMLWCGAREVRSQWTFDTRTIPDGLHTLRAVARDGTAVRTQGYCVVPFVVRNSDLECAVTGIEDGQQLTLGSKPRLTTEVTGAAGGRVTVDYIVEGKVAATETSAPHNFVLKTSDYGPGAYSVQARVTDSSGQRAVSTPVKVVVSRR